VDAAAGANDAEDDRLAAEFAAGSSRGLEGAYAAYGRRLYAAARHVLGSDDDAEDCVHDTLVRVWQRAQAYRPERGPLRNFLLVAVRNEALSRKRSAARHLAIEQRAARDESDVVEPDMADPTQGKRLRAAIAVLPDEQRAALELAYFGELTHVQVAP
jgi:RNA polymerase sigma-70 factor (ECF subfamily)